MVTRVNKSMKNIVLAIVGITLLVFSIYSFYNAYDLWSGYEWAMRRLEGLGPFIIGHPDTSWSKAYLAVREYATLFPLYFLAGLASTASVLILLAMTSRRRRILSTSILMISSAFTFLEAYYIWKTYQWAIQVYSSSNLYDALIPFIDAYGTLLTFCLVFGSVGIASGLILIAIGPRFKLRHNLR